MIVVSPIGIPYPSSTQRSIPHWASRGDQEGGTTRSRRFQSSASAAVTSGSWVQYPTGVTEYQAEVQQPINSGNTSNWSAKSKGAIPVMFKLSTRPGPAAFESIYADNPANTAN